MVENLSIPTEIVPSDGRYGSGPSLVRASQVQAVVDSGKLGTSHRKHTVTDIIGSIKQGLAELYQLPEGYEVALGLGGATCFWASALVSLVRSRAAFAHSGEFGLKFYQDAQRAPWITATEVKAPLGELATLEPLEGVDTYAYCHNETSTGVASPIYRVGGQSEGDYDDYCCGSNDFATSTEALTLVDGTSIAGAFEVDLSLTDAYYFSPQKAFGSEGGLWISFLSPAAIARATELAGSTDRFVPQILDLNLALQMSYKNNTVNTPAIATLILFDEQIRWMLDQGGLALMQERAQTGAKLIQQWAKERDYTQLFVHEPSYRSPVVTTVDIDESISVPKLAAYLRSYGIYDIEGYRGLKRNQLRIASFPAILTADIEKLLECIDWYVAHLNQVS